MILSVRVGYTTQRPIVPDECHRFVTVKARTVAEGTMIACQIVATNPDVEMVTSAHALRRGDR